MEKITDILFCEVENEDGKNLGHVFEFRSAGDPEHGEFARERKVTEILYGKRALLESLGLKAPIIKSFDMSRVKKIQRGKIIIYNADDPSDGKQHD